MERLLALGDLARVTRMASSLWYFWYVRGYSAEGLAWMERALPAATPESNRGLILLTASMMLGRQSRHQRSLEYVERSLPLLREGGDTEKEIFAHITLAYAASGLDRPALVCTALGQSLALAQASGPSWVVPHILASLARLEASLGSLDDALDLADQARSRRTPDGDPSVGASALLRLATVRMLRGETELAADHFHEALKFARSSDNPVLTSAALEGLVAVAATRGRHALSACLWGMAQRLRETGPATRNAPAFDMAPGPYPCICGHEGLPVQSSSAWNRSGHFRENCGRCEAPRRSGEAPSVPRHATAPPQMSGPATGAQVAA
jgi:tetratricopeptide (TPR) repeat protein